MPPTTTTNARNKWLIDTSEGYTQGCPMHHLADAINNRHER
jgi:hypothetical protein